MSAGATPRIVKRTISTSTTRRHTVVEDMADGEGGLQPTPPEQQDDFPSVHEESFHRLVTRANYT